MAIQLGMNSKMYYNTGTAAIPVWHVLGNATSRNFDLTKDTADTTTFDNNGWKTEVGTLKSGAVDFEMMWDTNDASFAIIQKHYDDSTPIEMMILDRDKDTIGSEGLHSGYSVNDFSQSADIADAMKASVKMSVSSMDDVATFWQRTYLTATGFTPAVGDPCYYDSAAGTVSATTTDVFVGDAVYAASADAPVMVDVNATAP